MVGPEATTLVLSIETAGFCVVGTYERVEAERLVRTAMQLARELGYPLRVSADEAGRWLRRALQAA